MSASKQEIMAAWIMVLMVWVERSEQIQKITKNPVHRLAKEGQRRGESVRKNLGFWFSQLEGSVIYIALSVIFLQDVFGEFCLLIMEY